MSATRKSTHRAKTANSTKPAITTPQHKPFEQMSFEEMETWLINTHAQLAAKKAREHAYLARREARGTYTPTDEAYGKDQVLESDLLAFLERCLAVNKERGA